MSQKKMSLSQLLDAWAQAKEDKTVAERKCQKYRQAVAQYMSNRETDLVETERYEVARRSTTRQSVARKDVPPEIWERYSTRSTYDTYTLKIKR